MSAPRKRERRARLDGRQRTKAAVLRRLAHQLGLPPHFGHNLDALHDSLTADAAGPLKVTWNATPAVRRSLGEDYPQLREALESAANEREDLKVEVKER